MLSSVRAFMIALPGKSREYFAALRPNIQRHRATKKPAAFRRLGPVVIPAVGPEPTREFLPTRFTVWRVCQFRHALRIYPGDVQKGMAASPTWVKSTFPSAPYTAPNPMKIMENMEPLRNME